MIRGQASNREIGLASAIMIVLVLYLYFSMPHTPVNPLQIFNWTCSFRGNLSCHQAPVLRLGDSRLEISLTQNTGSLINITSFVCTSRNEIPGVMPRLNNSVLIPNGEQAYVSGGNSGNTIICTGQDGRSIPSASSGDVYSGNIYIMYTEVKTGTVKFVNGTIVMAYS
ncbi:hypothetical protein H0N98_04425 [Candidatus Micrarchaeota archaeon]|nr:hypothetical protein [Candidatus Micrarchaeota archaeon]